MMPIKSMDVSNYSGHCDFHEAWDQGFRHVVVRLTTEKPGRKEIAIQQLQAAAAVGMTCSGYTWVYPEEGGYDFGDRCMQVAVEAGVPLKYVWADLEGGLDTTFLIPWARAFCGGVGHDQPVGIYTSPSWWYAHGSALLAHAFTQPKVRPKLWLAHYDDIPKLSDPYLSLGQLYPYRQLAGKQYHGSGVVAGVLCDLNVFRKGYA